MQAPTIAWEDPAKTYAITAWRDLAEAAALSVELRPAVKASSTVMMRSGTGSVVEALETCSHSLHAMHIF